MRDLQAIMYVCGDSATFTATYLGAMSDYRFPFRDDNESGDVTGHLPIRPWKPQPRVTIPADEQLLLSEVA